MNKYPVYASQTDRQCAAALVSLCLKGGNTISVWDGEDFAIKRSSSKLDILKEMSSTGEDRLHVFDEHGNELGRFYLIYNNGTSHMELIADHVANDWCEGIWNALEKKFG